MTKYRAWRYFTVIVILCLIMGIAALMFPAQPATAQDSDWVIETVDDVDVISTSLALDSNDYPHISYASGGLTSLHYARWTGTAWTKETVDPDMVWTTSLALDSGNRPHIGYSGLFSLDYAYLTSGAWTTEPVFPPGPVIVWDCSLALDSGDQPHMSFGVINPFGPEYALLYTYRTQGGWQSPELVYDDLALSSSIAIDRSDQPCISFSDGSLLYTDGGVPQPVDPGNPDIVVSTSLALDSSDRPSIAYATIDDGSLHYARWTGTSWALETVDPSPDIVDCSLALDSQNRPHICYLVLSGDFDGGDGGVIVGTMKYAHWTGSSWDIQTVDQEVALTGTMDMTTLNQQADILKEKIALPEPFFFFGSKFSSIAVDSDDLPHISYGSILPMAVSSLHYAQLSPTVVVPTTPSTPQQPSPPISRPLSPPQMSLQFLNISPQQASANQPVTITTNVVNTGDEPGNYNVALKINGLVEQSRMVSVGPLTSQPVKFTVTKAEPGTYTVDIVDQKGSFIILGDSDTGGTTGPKTGALIVLALIGILVIASVVVLLVRRA